MMFSGTSYLAVVVAAVAAFAFGSVWYMALGKRWVAALGITEQPKPTPLPVHRGVYLPIDHGVDAGGFGRPFG